MSKAFLTDRKTILFLIPLAWRRRTEDLRELIVKKLFISAFRVGHSILFSAAILVHKYLLTGMYTVCDGEGRKGQRKYFWPFGWR